MLNKLRNWVLYSLLCLATACGNGSNNATPNSIPSQKINHPPIIKTVKFPDATQDQAYSAKINAEDPDNDLLSYDSIKKPSWLSINKNTGSISGTPRNNDVGISDLELKISDGTLSATQNFRLKIINVNDAPTSQDISQQNIFENQQFQYQLNAADPDNDQLTYQVVNPAWLIVDSNGLLTGTPTNFQVGQHNLEIRISDGTATITKTSTINVVNTNDAPIVQDIPILNGTQGQTLQHQIIAADPDNNTLTYQVIKPSWMTVSSAGLLNAMPGDNNVGNNIDLEIRVSDGIATIIKTSKINIANVNDAPLIQTTSLSNATEDQMYNAQITAIDPDGDTITYTKISGNSWINISSNGLLNGTPTNDNVGINDLEIKASDGTLSTTRQYTINVINTNDAPQIISQPTTAAAEGSNYYYQIQAIDPDVGDVLNFFLTTNTSQNAINSGLAINQLTGLVSWSNVPSGNFNIELLAKDVDGAEARQSYSLIINDTVHNITGKITDAEGNGLAGIILQINSTQSITNSQGNYSFNGLPTGNYTLIIGDNFTTVFNYRESINLTNDTIKDLMLIKKLAISTITNEYNNSLGNPSFLQWLKAMTGTKQGQNTTFERWMNSNLPVQIYLNQSDADSSAPNFDGVTYDPNTGSIIQSTPNGTNDYLDFGRRAIKRWNDLLGFVLFQEKNTPVGANGIGIDFEYTSNTLIPGAEGVTIKDNVSQTQGFQYLIVQITDNYRFPVLDIYGNIIGYIYKDFTGTIMHEFGHCAGIGHSKDILHLMYSNGTGGQTPNGQDIHSDEIKIVKIMYNLPFKTYMTQYEDQ